MVRAVSYRDDGDALRSRVDALEEQLARSEREAAQLRVDRDRALAAAASPPPSPGAARYGPATKVFVLWGGKWWPATVLHETGAGLYRIHYDGWSSKWDETVGADRIAPADRPPPGPRAGGGPTLAVLIALLLVLALLAIGVWLAAASRAPRSVPASPPGAAVASAGSLAPGDAVWIDWNGIWYEGVVVSVSDPTIRVHYAAYADAYDEDVPLERVRAR